MKVISSLMSSSTWREAGIQVAMTFTRSLTVVKVAWFSGFALASATGEPGDIGCSTLTKSITWNVVGLAVRTSRIVSCWRASVVRPGQAPDL